MTTTVAVEKSVNRIELEQKVKDMYEQVARDPFGEFHFELGRALAERLGYMKTDLDRIPREAVDSFLEDCDSVLGQYLRGQVLVMLALALFYSIGLALFGFSLAVPVGVFTGLAVFIPYLGFGLGLVLALLAGLLQFPGSWWGVVAVAVGYPTGKTESEYRCTSGVPSLARVL